MAKVILVDDSASARKLLSQKLGDEGHEVIEFAKAADAAERALAEPPSAVVTDLWMPGISGLQLCRLLRSEPVTAHVPVVLLTASDDRRSRFWAKNAGATAYVTKGEIDRLLAIVGDAITMSRPAPSTHASATRGTIPERLSQLLDVALYESTVAGAVRALSQTAEDVEALFSSLATLASEVIGYRWLALATESNAARLYIHTHTAIAEAAEREARDALGIHKLPERRKDKESALFMISDGRAVEADWSAAPIQQAIRFGDNLMGSIAISPGRRGASTEDRRFLSIIGAELGGPLRMVSLMMESRRLASTDSLTGLFNRRAFAQAIDAARKKSPTALLPLSIILLDIDHFKKVNDTLGHDAGDAVLQGVARVLSSMARKSDVVARWGGEEFVVALTHTAEAGTRIAAERVRRAIADAKYQLPNGELVNATASLGLSSALDEHWTLEDLLTRADKALYSAKHRGRNRVETA
jgi:two-component system cell cycle response regulator